MSKVLEFYIHWEPFKLGYDKCGSTYVLFLGWLQIEWTVCDEDQK